MTFSLWKYLVENCQEYQRFELWTVWAVGIFDSHNIFWSTHSSIFIPANHSRLYSTMYKLIIFKQEGPGFESCWSEKHFFAENRKCSSYFHKMQVAAYTPRRCSFLSTILQIGYFDKMFSILPGLEPGIPWFVVRCLIHWATGPLAYSIKFIVCLYTVKKFEEKTFLAATGIDKIKILYSVEIVEKFLRLTRRSCGPMDKASDYESGDSSFESWQDRLRFLYESIL